MCTCAAVIRCQPRRVSFVKTILQKKEKTSENQQKQAYFTDIDYTNILSNIPVYNVSPDLFYFIQLLILCSFSYLQHFILWTLCSVFQSIRFTAILSPFIGFVHAFGFLSASFIRSHKCPWTFCSSAFLSII